ncbi:MAG: hypothetical protein KAJ34_05760, partial [Thermodesulfovibrionia bacterium]|nr:hypothetical protein [Thermodesulfovibrionia bacterium]
NNVPLGGRSKIAIPTSLKTTLLNNHERTLVNKIINRIFLSSPSVFVNHYLKEAFIKDVD